MSDRNHSHRQKELREKRDERAFLFDPAMSRCLAEVDRDEWEWAIEMSGGGVAQAAKIARIEGIPNGARALWGKSPELALDSYRHWLRRKAKRG